MTDSRPSDVVAGVLLALGLFASFIELFYRPFRIAPPALLIILIGLVMSSKHRRLGRTAAMVVATCFVIGASIAVWKSRALY